MSHRARSAALSRRVADVDPKAPTVEDTDTDDLLREVAAAPVVPVPADLATLVLLEPGVTLTRPTGVVRLGQSLVSES